MSMIVRHAIIIYQHRIWFSYHPYNMQAMEITSSSNVQVSGIRFEDNPHVHLVIDSSTDVYLSNLTVQAPGNSPNTDSLHIKASTNVFIDSCSIGTGTTLYSYDNIVSSYKLVYISRMNYHKALWMSLYLQEMIVY